jgi:hypothetical protein
MTVQLSPAPRAIGPDSFLALIRHRPDIRAAARLPRHFHGAVQRDDCKGGGRLEGEQHPYECEHQRALLDKCPFAHATRRQTHIWGSKQRICRRTTARRPLALDDVADVRLLAPFGNDRAVVVVKLLGFECCSLHHPLVPRRLQRRESGRVYVSVDERDALYHRSLSLSLKRWIFLVRDLGTSSMNSRAMRDVSSCRPRFPPTTGTGSRLVSR